jgi:hypothetical protein
MEWVPSDPADSSWLNSLVWAVGEGLLGVVFLVSSFSALRDRRRGGFAFLVGAPLASFCLTYPKAGFMETRPDGIYFVQPSIPAAVILSCVFFTPFFVFLLARRKGRLAVYLFLMCACAAGFAAAISPWTPMFFPRLAAWSGLFFAFGAFWLGTHKLQSPPLLATQPKPLILRLSRVIAWCLLTAALDLAVTGAWTGVRSSLWSADCGGSILFTSPWRPTQAVFTARLIRVGHAVNISGRWAGKMGDRCRSGAVLGLAVLDAQAGFAY